jgi:uncharacterized protein (DUF1778 family)
MIPTEVRSRSLAVRLKLGDAHQTSAERRPLTGGVFAVHLPYAREGIDMAVTKARLEARIDPELDELIEEAARQLRVTKTAFITDSLRQAAQRVTARAETTLMDDRVFDTMLASLDVADDSPALAGLAALPRRIAR